MTATAADIAAIRAALGVLGAPGEVRETRIPKAGRYKTVSGCYDDLDTQARDAAEWSGAAGGVYVTANPIAPSLLARSPNRLTRYAEHTTSDADIVRRRWLLMDFDPRRPAGISSSDAEHDAAIERAKACGRWLVKQGLPHPVLADSGNGGHLLLPIDLPTEDGGLVQRVLQALALHWDDEAVAVDQTTYNPARIWKVYGTKACKGADTPDRPHRYARLLYVPEPLAAASRSRLEALTRDLPPLGPATGPNGRGALDVPAWLARHGLTVRREAPWQGGRKWVLDVCPFNAEHTDDSAVVVQFPSGALAFRCHHNGCAGKDWYALRDLVEPGWRERANGHRPGDSGRAGAGAADDEPGTGATAAPEWPAPPDDAAYHGLAGEIVHTLAPTTEADPVALLLSVLAAVGNIAGPGPHWRVSGRRHGLRVYPVLVGPTSKGRKGTAWGSFKSLLAHAAPEWLARCVASGLSSGEGLIWAVRDPIEKQEPIREGGKRTGAIVGYETVILDAGVDDKRLLVIEEEFASTLKVMARENNILSAVIRQAWDDGDLRTLTKNSPARATGAHITIVGHITQDELLRYLDNTEAANGFANRFTWACVRRARILPDGGAVDPATLAALGARLSGVLEAASGVGLIARDDEAARLWRAIYGPLSEGGVGLLGAITSRSEAQVMRLAAIYAVLDRSPLIRKPHLAAAVALWDFLDASARHIFGDTLGDPIADAILRALRAGGEMTQTDISDLFGRNVSAGRLDRALGALLTAGKVRRETREPGERGGRRPTVWRAV